MGEGGEEGGRAASGGRFPAEFCCPLSDSSRRGMEWRKAGSRRPLFRKRPPLGRWGVTREFACASPSKAGLCPWPRVTGTDCGKWCSRKYFPESWKICRFSALGGRGWARWAWRVAAVKCCPLPDSSRHGMSWKICRFSAPRPEPRSAQEPPGHSPFRRLFRFSASVDHQMTPALFAGAFRAGALSPRSLADWLSGTPAAALRPKASRSLP